MIKKEDSLGIPNYGVWYLETLPNQIGLEEMKDIHRFLNNLVRSKVAPEFDGKSKRIEFINYGRTQLVYVLTVDENRQYTLLVTQPAAEKNIGKREFANLKQLSARSSNVINPMYYFQDKDNKSREVYITPYYYQARCIGVNSTEWGMWIPEPRYHYRRFSEDERSIINSSMVAILVSLYDEKEKLGISECRLDGGDFMIEKGFENYVLDFENMEERMKLIAARNMVQMDFKEYLERLKKELLGKLDKDEKNIILGKKIKCLMREDEVDQGILLGLKLKEKSKSKGVSL